MQYRHFGMVEKITSFLNKGNVRSVRAKKNIVAMALLKGISVICSLIVVPLTINYVSKYEYGIWLTISSLVLWLSFFDLGIGNGLRNKFTEAVEKRKYKLAKVYVSTAYAIITIIVSIIWLLAIVSTFYINWCGVLNAEESLRQELIWTVIIVVTNFSLLFVLGLNRTLLNAVQKPAIAASFDTATQVLLCIVLAILVNISEGSLVNLALAMGATSLVVLITSNILTFSRFLKPYRPSCKNVRFKLAKEILSVGILFFFLQVRTIVFYQTNNFIISHYIGPSEVTVYNIAYKYMQVLTMLFTILITPFWSAYAEANINGDFMWMNAMTSRLIKSVGYIAALGVVMVAISPIFYRIWLNGEVVVPLIVTVLVYCFHLSNIWSTLWNQLLYGFGKIRLQIICSTLCCVCYLPLSIWGCKYFGLVGLLVASLISFALFNSWFGIIQVKRLINGTASGIWNK